MPLPARFRPSKAAKLLLLAPVALFALIGIADVIHGKVAFWRNGKRAPRSGTEAIPEAAPAGRDGKAGDTVAERRKSILRTLKLTDQRLSPAWPARPAAQVIPHRYAGEGIGVDTADRLEIGEKGRGFYHEDLLPYRTALGWGKLEFVPVRLIRKGPFESIRIFGLKDSLAYALFTLTLNHRTRRVIQRNVPLEDEGVHLHSVSPSGRSFVLDRGCCPGAREFEIYDSEGSSRLRASYYGEMRWAGESLRFWKVERILKAGETGNPCPGRLEERIAIRKTAFREGRESRVGRQSRESPSDSVLTFCSGPG